MYEISLKSSNYKILKHDFSKTENFSLSMEELLLTIFKRSKMTPRSARNESGGQSYHEISLEIIENICEKFCT